MFAVDWGAKVLGHPVYMSAYLFAGALSHYSLFAMLINVILSFTAQFPKVLPKNITVGGNTEYKTFY